VGIIFFIRWVRYLSVGDVVCPWGGIFSVDGPPGWWSGQNEKEGGRIFFENSPFVVAPPPRFRWSEEAFQKINATFLVLKDYFCPLCARCFVR